MNTTTFAIATTNEALADQHQDAATVNEVAMRQLLDAELFFVGGGAGEVIVGSVPA